MHDIKQKFPEKFYFIDISGQVIFKTKIHSTIKHTLSNSTSKSYQNQISQFYYNTRHNLSTIMQHKITKQYCMKKKGAQEYN